MKFKGQTLQTKQREYVLKDQLTEGGFSMIYTTSYPQIICKAQVLSVPQISHAYKKQKQILTQFKNHPNIVKLFDAIQMNFSDNPYGFLLMQNCSNGTAFTQLQACQGSLSEKDILKIFISVCNVLESLHKEGISHRDIKLENVLRNQKGQYKVCDFGSTTGQIIRKIDNNNRVQIQQFIQKTTTPLYRSPQQLDLYSGFQIGPKVDVFAVGVMIFMLCFKKQPFQSRLSAINKQYFIPQDCVYSQELLGIIQKCFTTNPQYRPTAKQLKQMVLDLSKRKKALIQLQYSKQVTKTIDELSRVNAKTLNKQSKEIVVETSFFDRLKLIYTQYTTETEGWIRGFVEDSEQAPPLKYNRFIISKCWQKRYKIQKVYQIIWEYAQQYQSKSLVILKLLILIHNFLRKGPTEAMEYDKEYSPIRLATKLYKQWKLVEKPTSETDVKRNVFLCLLIRYYCLIIIGKARFGYENSQLFQGNYSIVPFFQKKHELTLLKIPILQSMLQFLEVCSSFHQTVQNKSYVLQIQRSIILSIVDEEYCLVSTFVFTYAAFKHGINYVDEDLDIPKIERKLQQIQERFQRVYLKLSELFEVAQKFSTLFQNNTFLLNKSVITHLKSIKISNQRKQNFKIAQYLNYKDSIGGLKLPLTYEQVIKNPNFLKDLTNKSQNQNAKKQRVEVDQFKMKNQNHNNNKNQKQQEHGNVLNPNIKSNPNIQESPSRADSITNTFNVNISESQKHNSIASFEEFGNIGKPSLSHQTTNPNRNLPSTSILENKEPVQNQNKNQNSEANQKLYNTMEFTHQNLNRDFMTNQLIKESQNESSNSDNIKKGTENNNGDKFRDFMSIVDQKVDEDRKNKNNSSVMKNNEQSLLENQKENFNSQNSNQGNAGTSTKNKVQEVDLINAPEVFLSSVPTIEHYNERVNKNQSNNPNQNRSEAKQKSVIKKIEIINFFEDEEEEQPPSSQKKIEEVKVNTQNLLDEPRVASKIQSGNGFEESFNKIENLNKTDFLPNQKENNLIDIEQKRQVKSEKELKSDSFIDLKGFVIEEVRRNAEQYLIDFRGLKFYEKVGNGHSSEVYRGQWRGRQVAIKKIKDDMKSPTLQKQFKRQIMTSVKIRNHPQLVTLIGVAQSKGEYYIINEFCYGLTLFDLLHESNIELPWKIRISIAKQIAKGIVFLHTNQPPIIHRDLKSLNVLLANKYQQGQSQINIKIADFGLSRDFASTYMTGTLGTYHWMAPQIFNNEPYSLKADVYSYGIVLWQIASRSPPYRNMLNPQALMKFVTIENGRPDITAIDKKCPLEIRMLMMRCWDRFPSNRPSFNEILNVLNSINL